MTAVLKGMGLAIMCKEAPHDSLQINLQKLTDI